MAKSKNLDNKIGSTTILAFERKLANSDALMHAGNWSALDDPQAWQPIAIQSQNMRGTISNRLSNAIASDPAKLNAEIQKPNPQGGDAAALPFDADTLKVSFTLRVLGDLATPSACNNPKFQVKLAQIVDTYIREQQFQTLAARYAENLANGRFLWRNRVGAEAVTVRVTHRVDRQVAACWSFDALSLNLRQFSEPTGDLAALAEVIRQGLLGHSFALLQVEAFVRLGVGQEVFPSQELIIGEKRKTLYRVADVAAMHSQKIGNALRTIDTWYPDADGQGPIAVEPYGAVTSRGRAYREPKAKMDFYNLLDKWVHDDEVPSGDQQNFVIATLIRGGVFGDSKDAS